MAGGGRGAAVTGGGEGGTGGQGASACARSTAFRENREGKVDPFNRAHWPASSITNGPPE